MGLALAGAAERDKKHGGEESQLKSMSHGAPFHEQKTKSWWCCKRHTLNDNWRALCFIPPRVGAAGGGLITNEWGDAGPKRLQD
jgi:hypothetical protein